MVGVKKKSILNFTKKILQTFLAVLVLFSVNVISTNAAGTSVDLYFSPSTVSVPPNGQVSLFLDPKGQSISFLRVKLYFNPDIIQLASEVNVSGSPLSKVVLLTPSFQANTTGIVEIVLILEPGHTAPSSVFKFATLSLKAGPNANGSATEMTFLDEDTQIVDTNFNDLIANTNFLTVNTASVSPQAAPKAFAAAVPQNIANILKGNCANEDFIDTAIGCIPYKDMNAMAKFLLSWGIGIAGGIAFILIAYAGFIIITSSGNPEKLQSGKELLTAAISGLLLLILSSFILRVIGIDILGIFNL